MKTQSEGENRKKKVKIFAQAKSLISFFFFFRMHLKIFSEEKLSLSKVKCNMLTHSCNIGLILKNRKNDIGVA